MPITELRILPPLAIGRLGAASEPLEAFDLESSPERPLDYRSIVPKTTLEVDKNSGEIVRVYEPESIRFKNEDGKIRPVAPFLEVFALTSEQPDELQPLTVALLAAEGLSLNDVSWQVSVANIKVFRRTNNNADKITANVSLSGQQHARQSLDGLCDNFLPGRILPLGWVQFVCPSTEFPGLRLRFTPGPGLVYGSALERHTSKTQTEPDPIINDESKVLYDTNKGTWRGYGEGSAPWLTNPAQIFAGYDSEDGITRISWGYLDDECDGYVRVTLKRQQQEALSAQSVIGAGPPAFAPDTMPVRVVSDELEQILFGPVVTEEEVPIEEAEQLVYRALETVRLMNTAVMNGNLINGRPNVASTMVRQDTSDFERLYAPIAATSLVDNLALRALHERVFGALAAGSAPWFADALRRPEDIGDLSDKARRKMPALMRGADGRGLTLTRRQIDTVIKAASQAMFRSPDAQPVSAHSSSERHDD